MSKLWAVVITLCMCAGLLFATVAEAKRFGGGSSMGRSYSTSHASSASAARPATAAAPNRSSWLGPLAGLAAGGLLASLFMGHGSFGSLILLLLGAIAVIAVFRMLRRGIAQPHDHRQTVNYGPTLSPREAAQNYGGGGAATTPDYPAGFDVEGFLRGAKILFVRLQASNDKKNLADIGEFTTPEMFAEVSMQMQERGDAPSFTEVVRLDAQVLQVFKDRGNTIASVRFSGLIREQEQGPAENFVEIWHFQQDGTSWRVAGIEQA